MSRSGRLIAIAATLVVLVVAFVVLSPGDDKQPATATTTPTTSTPAGTTAAPATPKPTTVVVRAGKPVGGVKRIEVKKGAPALIDVSSPDTSDEIHLHGYDLKRDLKAGGRVRFMFTAKNDGIYEMELEGAGVQIAELVVEP
ncbi:MAG: hypothetical protein QOE31_709 [Solirubrobacteraceae bacterium]|nr:hypothetical protein [Solirubrobacteraceae bacterium]